MSRHVEDVTEHGTEYPAHAREVTVKAAHCSDDFEDLRTVVVEGASDLAGTPTHRKHGTPSYWGHLNRGA